MQWERELESRVAQHFPDGTPRALLDDLHGMLEREYAQGHGDGFESGLDLGYRNGVEDRGRWADV